VGPPPWVASTLSGHESLPKWVGDTHALPRRARRDQLVGVAIFSSLAALMLLGLNLAGRAVPARIEDHRPVGGAVAELLPTATAVPAPTATAVPTPPPAQVDVDFEHGLKSGMLRIFIDDEAVFRQNIGAQSTKRIIGIPIRKGKLTETVEVPPG